MFRLFGGLILDIKRKVPFYLSDFKDGLSLQCVASFLFLYCACMSPVITFGGLLGEATEGHIVRANDTINDTVDCRVFYEVSNVSSTLERHRVLVWCIYDRNGLLSVCWSASYHSGQHRSSSGFWKNPLQILQVSKVWSPFTAVQFQLQEVCLVDFLCPPSPLILVSFREYDLSYLSLRTCIGLWTAFLCLILVATDASSLVCYITRFTEEAFAALICLIFIFEALEKLFYLGEQYPYNAHSDLDRLTLAQ